MNNEITIKFMLSKNEKPKIIIRKEEKNQTSKDYEQ